MHHIGFTDRGVEGNPRLDLSPLVHALPSAAADRRSVAALLGLGEKLGPCCVGALFRHRFDTHSTCLRPFLFPFEESRQIPL